MGVYRLCDFKHGKPIYKQDGGEHYLYFHGKSKMWMVGPRPNHSYAWLRNRSDNQSSDVLAFASGWQYQPIAREGNPEPAWMEDDESLKVEAIGGES